MGDRMGKHNTDASFLQLASFRVGFTGIHYITLYIEDIYATYCGGTPSRRAPPAAADENKTTKT